MEFRFTVPDDLVEKSQLKREEVKEMLVLFLYEKKRLSTEQAARMLDLSLNEFYSVMNKHDVDLNLTEDSMDEDAYNTGALKDIIDRSRDNDGGGFNYQVQLNQYAVLV